MPGQLQRVAHGIYAQLRKHPVWGVLQPSTDSIAKAISRRDKARIIPTGSAALNGMGLSTQVPGNVVYLTDGPARTISIDGRKIVFRKKAPRNLATIGKISTLAIQALKTIGKAHVTDREIRKIVEHLLKEKPSALEHDIRLAPKWIRVILRKALQLLIMLKWLELPDTEKAIAYEQIGVITKRNPFIVVF